MQSAALAVRLLTLALAVYLLMEGVPTIQRLARGGGEGPPPLPAQFEWVDKTKGLRILHFYAAPGAVRRGEEISLCYGVAQAKAARIESARIATASEGERGGGVVPGVWPSFNRCVMVTPRRDTRYTLVAEDGAGGRREVSVEVTVLPAGQAGGGR